jgi:hypothetical protein
MGGLMAIANYGGDSHLRLISFKHRQNSFYTSETVCQSHFLYVCYERWNW